MKKRIAFTCMLALFIFAALTYFAGVAHFSTHNNLVHAQGPWNLTVSSAYDTPSPPSGSQFANGTDVTESVTSPTPGGLGTQDVCTGWSGSGDVPSTGTTSSVTFTITQDSSITWNWKTQYYLTVSSVYGSASGQGWYDAGSTANFGVTTPISGGTGTQYVFTAWSSSDTGGYTGSSASQSVTMNNPITETASWKTQYFLTVSSAYGTTGGQGWYDSGSTAYAALSSGTVSGGAGTQYIFTSWSGDASGTGLTSNAITMSGPMTATANWKTQYFLTVSSAYDTPGGGGWYDSGSTAYAALSSGTVSGGAGTQYVFTSWGTDASGTNYVQSDVITMNAAKTATANWKTQYLLAVTSPYDSPTPLSGWFDSGSGITESVTSPVTVGSSIWTCTGWSGSGSVPLSGTVTSVLFSITQNSGITWTWQVLNHTLTVSSPHDSPNPSNGPHTYSDGSSVTCSVTSPVTEGSIVWTCTGWTGTGSVPSTGSGSSTGSFTMAQDSSITWNWHGALVQHTLTVYSAHGSPTPGVGGHPYDDGSPVTCSVSSPVTEGSTVWTCTGWTGSGSVPSSGSGTTVSFSITQDSSITWNWQGGAAQHTLTVSSAHGSPNPGIGQHVYSDGYYVTCNVTSPVTEGSIVWTCTGWTGTGSVPSSGSGSSVSFAIGQDSSITWNWQGSLVQHSLTVSSLHDSPNPSNGAHLYSDGSSVTCYVSSPVTESGTVWTCTGWTGSGSVPSSGTVSSVSFAIGQDSSITWNWHGNAPQHNLTVTSVHGTPSPAVGKHPYDQGDNVTCSVTSPVTENSVTYFCTGWSGSGSVPPTGSGTSVTFTILQDSSITWNWKVEWKLTVASAHSSPSPAVGDHFYNDKASITCTVTSPVIEAGISYTCTGWLGTGSVPSNGSDISVTFSITQNSTITWNWVVTPSVHWNLTVVSAHGNPDPTVGDQQYNDGASIPCNVTSPVVEADVSYTCIGWTGTGSVPSSGSDISVTFTITENSSITWNWVVTSNVRNLAVTSAHGSPSPSVGDHPYTDGSPLTCSVTSPVTEAGQVWNCTGWVGTGSVPSNGTGTSATFTITENSTITWNWIVTATVQWTLTVISAHGSPSPAVGDHLYNNSSSVVCSVTSPVVEAGVSYTCTGWTRTSTRAMSSGSGTSTTFTITENSTITWNWQETPTIGSCDNTGVQKNAFTPDETVYVTGAGYAKNQIFNIYIVNETTWVDGMALPERVPGTATSVSSDSSGNINTTIVWNEPLTSGNYDILIDVNGNGKYDAQVDASYSIQIVTAAESFLIPEYVFGTILGLVGCFAALGAFRIYKRKR
jgi:hypothetical protein